MKSVSMKKYEESRRYHLLDMIRGITLLSMILYHGSWDLVYIYGVKWSWYKGTGAYIWQQSICWTFILLSGFCWSLGKKPFKRGLMVFGGGLIVSIITLIFMPQNKVVFGVLTFIGSAMLLMIIFDKWFQRILPEIGVVVSFLLFLLTRNINRGTLGFEGLEIIDIPASWYQGTAMTYLGFPAPVFYSTDYFSLFPWFFLFTCGYFIYHIFQKRGWLHAGIFRWDCKPLGFLGKNCLLIYLLHQPVLYGIFSLFFY